MKLSLSRWTRLFPLLALGLSSCLIGSFAPTTRHVPFNEADFAGYDRAGSGSVSGQVSTDYDGKHHIAERQTVRLIPVTPYTDEMVTRELGYGTHITRADARFKKYLRYAKTDDQGHFAFHGVPPGRYYAIGFITWDSGDPDNPTDFRWSCERITLGKGQGLQLNLARNPQIGNSAVMDSFSGDL
jgi:hypothetical protein